MPARSSRGKAAMLGSRQQCAVGAVLLGLAGSIANALPSVRLPDPDRVASQSGAAVLEIPIPTPRGKGGFQPDLRLRYSSQGGDGPFGVGWSLSLPEIRRTTRFGPPDHSTSPYDYELDGQLLFAETGPGSTAGRYHTLTETFQRILKNANSWEVTAPNGIKSIFGGTPESRIGDVRWHLSEMVDPAGNRICFTYEQEENVAYLAVVTYTHEGACTSASDHAITFTYEPRLDDSVGYLPSVGSVGYFWKLKKRATTIAISVSGAPRQTLVLTYDASTYPTKRSRLTSVQRCADTDVCSDEALSLPVTTYTWTDAHDFPRWGSTGFPLPSPIEEAQGANKSRDLGWRVGDLDADGIPELVRSYEDYDEQADTYAAIQAVYRRTPTGYVLDQNWTSALQQTGFVAPVVALTYTGTNLTSVNDNSGATRGMYFAERKDPLEPWIDQGDVQAFRAPVHARLVDVNGDRRADLLASYVPAQVRFNDGVAWGISQVTRLWLNNGAGWTAQAATVVAGLPAFEMLFIKERQSDGGFENIPDDGKCIRGSCTVKAALLPSGSQLADVNGDGLIDVLQGVADEQKPGSVVIQSGAFLQVPGGGGFASNNGFSPLFTSGTMKHLRIPKFGQLLGLSFCDLGVRYVDVNGDGMADLVKGRVSGSENNALGGAIWGDETVYLSTGSGWAPANEGARFKPPTPFLDWDGGNGGLRANHVVFADLNGDGLVDVSRTRAGQTQSWLQDPKCAAAQTPSGCIANTVWRPVAHFDPPMPVEATLEVNYVERSRTKGVVIADFDGNGAVDFLKNWSNGGSGSTATHYGTSEESFSDRLKTVDNGEGGKLSLVYESLVAQRDDSPGGLEADAIGDAADWGDFQDRFNPAIPVLVWAQYEAVAGPDQPSKTLEFEFAGSIWDPGRRISFGPRVMQIRRPDAHETRYVRQVHGIAGRLSWLESALIGSGGTPTGSGRRISQDWETFLFFGSNATNAGTWQGAWVGRLARDTVQNYYPGELGGALQETIYDGYGKYNFATSIVRKRPSGDSNLVRTPSHLEADWILGRAASETVYEGLSTTTKVRETTYAYHAGGGGKGNLQTRVRTALPALYGGAPSTQEHWTYDDFGNPATYQDPLGRVTAYCYDGGSLPGLFGACPVGGGLSGVLEPPTTAGTNEAVVFERDPLTGEVLKATRKHQEGTGVNTLDELRQTPQWDGRITQGVFAAPANAPAELLETRAYGDGVGSFATRTLYADDQNSIATTVFFDGFGRPAREVGPGARVATAGILRRFDHADRVIEESYPAACTATDCVDWEDVAAAVSLRKYDGLGRLLEEKSFDETNTYTYSQGTLGSLSTTPPFVPGSSTGFDVVTHRNPRNYDTRYWQDGDRVARVDECVNCSDAGTTDYAYEVTGAVRAIFNHPVIGTRGSAQNRTAFIYDTLGQVVEQWDPDGPEGDGKRFSSYDAAGNLRQFTNVRDQVLRYHYDSWNRVMRIDVSPFGETPGAGDTTVDYNDTGSTGAFVTHERAGVDGPDYDYTYSYDRFGRLASEALDTQSKILHTNYAYDRLGRPTVINYPITGSRLLYKYEGAHLIQVCGTQPSPNETQCNASQWWLSNVQYDGVGRAETLSTVAGSLVYTYNGEYRLGWTQFNGGPTQVSLNYGYDNAGNLVSRNDSVGGNGVSLSAGYTYDGRNRVKTFEPGSSVRTYVYDVLGNLKERPRVPGNGVQLQHFDTPGAPYRLAGVTPPGGSRVNFQYDADGNRLTDPTLGRHYSWDTEGRLTKVGTSQNGGETAVHGYDLDGRRIYSKFESGTKTHIYAGDLFDYSLVSGEKSTMYVYAFGRLLGTRQQKNALRVAEGSPESLWPPALPPPIAVALLLSGTAGLLIASGAGAALRQRPAAGSVSVVLVAAIAALPAHGDVPQQDQPVVRFYVTDPVGGAIVALDSAGNQKARRLFEPYGEVENQWAPEGTAQWYAGRPQESATELFDFHARWYDARTGGFLSVDPIIASLEDPQQHNAYGYARGNPVTLGDPSGLSTEEVPIFTTPQCYYGAACSVGEDGPHYGVGIGYDASDYFGDRGPGVLSTHGPLGGSNPFEGLPGGGARIETGNLDLNFTGLGASSQGGNVSQYDTSVGTLFGHYLSGEGGVVEHPLSDIDTGIGPAAFPGFHDALARAPAGASSEISPLRYQYDQGSVRAGQVSIQLRGIVEKDVGGQTRFYGSVRGVDQRYNFERRALGDRTPGNEVATTIGRNIPGVPFLIRYVGERPVTYPRRRKRTVGSRRRARPSPWLAVLLLLGSAACDRGAAVWFVDGQFSDALTIDAAQHRAATGFEATDAVTTLQVFRSSQSDSELMDVDRIRVLPLILEVRELAKIGEYLRAAQETVTDVTCNPYEAQMVLHFLAFDTALQRVGYFRYYPCGDGSAGAIWSSGSSAVVYTRALASLIGRAE